MSLLLIDENSIMNVPFIFLLLNTDYYNVFRVTSAVASALPSRRTASVFDLSSKIY